MGVIRCELALQFWHNRNDKNCTNLQAAGGNESMAGMEDVLVDPETEEALAEFDFLVSESGEGGGESRGDGTEWGLSKFNSSCKFDPIFHDLYEFVSIITR